jgi:hypothetical protein
MQVKFKLCVIAGMNKPKVYLLAARDFDSWVEGLSLVYDRGKRIVDWRIY